MGAPMRALVKAHPEPGLWAETVGTPDIPPDSVLVKIRKTSVCGTGTMRFHAYAANSSLNCALYFTSNKILFLVDLILQISTSTLGTTGRDARSLCRWLLVMSGAAKLLL
jgi:hypothetical protein